VFIVLLRLQNIVLEMIAKGEPLNATIDRLCLEVEAIVPEVVCSVLTVDRDGLLHPLSSPSLPTSYSSLFDGLGIGPGVGSCGTAAFRGEPVAVTDIATDPLWDDYRHLALPLGLAACWSSPIVSGEGRVIATFAFYYRQKRGPGDMELAIVSTCAHLCTIALERHERVLERDRLAHTDALTGLWNRGRFDEVWQRVTIASGIHGLLLIDIDNLKGVNDTLGHRTGDTLIQTIAARAAISVAPHALFRLSGDEFAVIVEPAADLASLAANILTSVAVSAECNGHSIVPRVTVGGASLEQGQSIEDLRHRADFALYHAKEKGRGQFVLHTPELATSISRRFDVVRDVALAIDQGRLETHYQPVVRLDSGRIVGFEALCRMRSPRGELIAAAQFADALTDARLASRITKLMMENVAHDLRHWLDLEMPVEHVGINLSAVDFQLGDLRRRLFATFEEAGVSLKHVILEVTESVYLGDRHNVVATEIRELRRQGLLVALDDFGTGYASLTHLLTIPVDILKIDKSFVDGLSQGSGGAAIIRGILGIARDLGIRVVAEGVETLDQVRELMTLGCVLGQGYYFSRPVTRQVATGLLMQAADGSSVHRLRVVN
jgi:diguanylate cyclase (GGDEF)-like protein